ncbi:MAG: hypothetical protein AABX83_03660 [Nanoarchaeota archaeon]
MAIGWIVIAVLIILLFVTIFKTQDALFIFALLKKYGFLFVAIFGVLFICFSFYHIYKTYDVDFTNFDGIVRGGKLYLLWFKSLFVNFGNITGYAVKQDWILNSNVTKVAKTSNSINITKAPNLGKK